MRPLTLALSTAVLLGGMIAPAPAGVKEGPGSDPLATLSTGLRTLPPVIESGAAAFALAGDPGLEGFRARHGDSWSVVYDTASGRPSLLSGAGIPLVAGSGNTLGGATVLSLPAVAARVRALVERDSAWFGVTGAELVLAPERSGSFADGRIWLVDFDRVQGGIPIEGSRVFARINHGNLVQLGFDRIFPVEPVAPLLTSAAALARGFAHAGGREAGDEVVEPGVLAYRPIGAPDGSGYGARLLWRVVFRKGGRIATWTARIDARSGEVIEFYDQNRHVSGEITGQVHPRTVTDPQDIVVPFPLARVQIGNEYTVTDSQGRYASGAAGNVTFTLDGLSPPGGVYVRNARGATASVTDSSGTAVVNQIWTDGVSRADERNAFYHLHAVRAFNEEIATAAGFSLPWFGTMVNASVNLTGSCNAAWDGSSLSFNAAGTFPAGGRCSNSAEIADIVMHEWGHGLDQHHGGAADAAGGEAIGDITAWLVTRDPVLGPGLYDPTDPPFLGPMADFTAVRDAAKLVSRANLAERCPVAQPSGCGGPLGFECHCEGLVLSGAVWDLATLLEERVGADAAFATVARLHFLAMPSWTDYLQAYAAFLAIDDDNGNLADGTPNGCLIHEAFDRHGIAGAAAACSTPIVRLALVSATVLDQGGDGDDVADPGETVELKLRLRNGGNAEAAQASALVATTDPGVALIGPTASFAPIPSGGSVDSAAPHATVRVLPGTACGALVPFAVALADSSGSASDGSFPLVIGKPVATLYAQGFEASAPGWTGNGGNATAGQWLAGTPRLTAQDGDVWQPGSVPEGSRCFYTGENGYWDEVNLGDVDGGTAVAESPPLDLTVASHPVLQFRYWFTGSRGATQPGDVFEVELWSGAGVATVFREATPKSEWRFASVPLTSALPLGTAMRLRFKATDDAAAANLVEAAIDDVKVLEFDCATRSTCALQASPASPGPLALCAGESRELTVAASGCGAGPITYQWRRDGVAIPGATGPAYTLPPGLGPGNVYDVEVGCAGLPGCTVVAGPITVDVALVSAVIHGAPLVRLCHGTDAVIDGSRSSVLGCPGGPLYSWFIDGVAAPGEALPTLTIPAPGPGNHRVEIEVACGSLLTCATRSAPVTVSVTRVAAAIANVSPAGVCADSSIVLDGSPTRVENCPGGASYQWFAGGQAIPGATSLLYATPPLPAGRYEFSLHAGCDALPVCGQSADLAVVSSSGTVPEVGSNSLRATAEGAATRVQWQAPSIGNWNVHRTVVKSELPDLVRQPAIALVQLPSLLDLESPPPGQAWFYQAFGADCAGNSVP